MEVSLVQKWEQTRFDQAQLLHDKDEKELCKQQKLFVHKIESEQRLIHDIEGIVIVLHFHCVTTCPLVIVL